MQPNVNVSYQQDFPNPTNTAQKNTIKQQQYTSNIQNDPRMIDLQQNIDYMLSYDIENFRHATNYFDMMCNSQDQSDKEFMQSQSVSILETFTEVIQKVFESGINFDLDQESYQLIFNPLQNFCKDKEFINALDEQTANTFVYQVLFILVTSNDEKTELHN